MAEYKKKKKKGYVNPTNGSIKTIKSHIASGSFARVYLLFGEEKFLVNQFRDELKAALTNEGDDMNTSSYSADTFDEKTVFNDAITMPFLSEHRVVIVEDSGLFGTSESLIVESLDQIPETNIVIFCESKVDKTRKNYLHASKNELACCLEFDTPDTDTLVTWIGSILAEDDLKVKLSVPDLLLSSVGDDRNMYLLRNEARKLHDYCLEKGTVEPEDVAAVCADSVEDKIFIMCEEIANKNSSGALKHYLDLLQLKRTEASIILMITRQYDQLLVVSQYKKDGLNAAQINEHMKIGTYNVNKILRVCSNYTHAELIKAVDLCHEAFYNLTQGIITNRDVAENLIINLIK